MLKSLKELFLESVQAVSGVAPSMFLTVNYSSLVKVVEFIEGAGAASYAEQALRKLFARQNWILDAQALEAFFQLMGEVQFWMLAVDRGIQLTRIPETNISTPDFQIQEASVQFEVKTFSVKDGWRNLAAMAEDSFQSQLELQKQVSRGERIAIAVHSTSPHGSMPRGLQQTGICRNLIDKASSNIKLGQYVTAPTFLVLNLMLINGYFNGIADLRPVAPGYPHAWSVRTGALWTLAFGSVGQIVHGVPEFEGLPSVEGKLEREGVLVNPDYKDVAGLLLIVHRLDGEPTLYGLWRESDAEQWESERPDTLRMLHRLVDKNWNNDRDTNGWQLIQH